MRVFLALALVAGFSGPCLAANLVVVEARGIALKPGAVLDAGKVLVLKQGQHLTLISETGSTLRLDGPYDKSPASASDQGHSISATLSAFTTEHQARTGEAGITRGATAAMLPDPWLVDATHSGNGCLLENRTPVFWRPDAAHPATLAVAPDDRSWKAQAHWPTGEARLSITTDVPMHSGETYVVSFNGNESAVSMVLVPASLTNNAMRAAWMADKGCEAQAEALLKTAK
jgi:hypothetical protein